MRDWKGLVLVVGSLAAGVLGARAPGARADAHKDDKLGYSFNYPARWTAVPVDAGEWLVAKFNCNREYEVTNARMWSRQRPYIDVLVIPFAPKDAKDAKATREVPWKDLKDYLDKTFQSRVAGGFHLSGEEPATVGGLKVRKFEVTLDKTEEGERRVYGWEFATDDAYYGLVAEILVQEEKRLKDDVFQSFSTFRAFPRTGSLPNAARPGAGSAPADAGAKKGEEKEISPEEMKKKRDDATNRSLARIKENLPKGWTVSETKNFIGVSDADAKYTREVLTHAEALRAWLETQFGFVGSGYAGRVVIRVFGDRQEYEAYRGARAWSLDAPETIVYKDRDGWSDWGLKNMNGEIYKIWLRDKNDRLAWALPQWLEFGLQNFVEQARSKAGKIEFKFDTWDSVEMKNARRADTIYPAGSYFTTPSSAFWAQPGANTQTQFFMNFLVLGAASRSAKYRNILSDYLKGLIFVLDSMPPDATADQKPPQNAKEEFDLIVARREAWRRKEPEVLPKLVERVFTNWGDKDWAAFDALYRQDLK